MNKFKDMSNNLIFEVDQSIAFKQDTTGIYRFYRDGTDLDWPTTFVPYTPPVPPPTLADIQAQQVAKISMDCQSAIYSGFNSSALGAIYHYPAKDQDQLNLVGAYSASLQPNIPTGWTTPFWCADSTGAWALRPHTATQIQQVYLDGVKYKTACIEQNDSLATQIMNAATFDAVQAITWQNVPS
ncbi:MAG: hypothetical protein WC426_14080 [Sulfuriferula sp.]